MGCGVCQNVFCVYFSTNGSPCELWGSFFHICSVLLYFLVVFVHASACQRPVRVLLVLHCVFLLPVHVTVLLSFAGFALCFVLVCACHGGPNFAEFCWFCTVFSSCSCMSRWSEFCSVLHCVFFLFLLVSAFYEKSLQDGDRKFSTTVEDFQRA